MTKKLIRLKIGIVIEDEIDESREFDDIGEEIAYDIWQIYNNGEDFFEVEYLGTEEVDPEDEIYEYP